MNGTIWRIILFFVGSIIVMGLVIPYNDPGLSQNGDVKNVALSPFTLVFIKSGIKPAVHIMNAIILTTILSAGNSGLYVCTRVLYALANEGKAPKMFGYLTKNGIPIWCLVFTTIISTILFGISFIGNQIIYQWLVNITGVMGFIAWFGIALSHWRFRRAYVLQGYQLNDLVYKALLFPVGPIFASILIFISIFGQGYSSFTKHPFNFSNFLSAYITIPVFLIIYFSYKFIKKTKIVPLREMDLLTDSLRLRQQDQTISINI
jgi:lysine-specific permease